MTWLPFISLTHRLQSTNILPLLLFKNKLIRSIKTEISWRQGFLSVWFSVASPAPGTVSQMHKCALSLFLWISFIKILITWDTYMLLYLISEMPSYKSRYCKIPCVWWCKMAKLTYRDRNWKTGSLGAGVGRGWLEKAEFSGGLKYYITLVGLQQILHFYSL